MPSPFGGSRKSATIATTPSPSTHGIALSDDAQAVKHKRSFFKRKLSRASQTERPPLPTVHSIEPSMPSPPDPPKLPLLVADLGSHPLFDIPLEPANAAPGGSLSVPYHSLSTSPLARSPLSTPRTSLDMPQKVSSPGHSTSLLRKLIGGTHSSAPTTPASGRVPRSTSSKTVPVYPEVSYPDSGIDICGMNFPFPPTHPFSAASSAEWAAVSSEGPSSPGSMVSSYPSDSCESSPNKPITPTSSWESQKVPSSLKSEGKCFSTRPSFDTARPSLDIRPSMDVRPSLDMRRPSMDKRPSLERRRSTKAHPSVDENGVLSDSSTGRSIAIVQRRRSSTHSSSVRPKELPPLPPRLPPPSIPLPPNPMQLRQALEDERQRVDMLEEKLRSVMVERDALVDRVKVLEGENQLLRAKDSSLFMTHMLSQTPVHLAGSCSTDQVNSNVVSRGTMPTTEPLRIPPKLADSRGPTPRPSQLPRNFTYPEAQLSKSAPSPSVDVPLPVTSQIPVPARNNAMRIRHGPSRSISSLPLPSSVTSVPDGGRGPGLHGPRPATAGGRLRRPTFVERK